MIERWKPIEGFEGLYEVSDMGRVKSLQTTDQFGRVFPEKILICSHSANGYTRVVLYKNRVRHEKSVHRLVACSFLSNPTDCPCVNHKNEVKDDNRAANLEWCTYQYNNSYGTGHIRSAITKGRKVASTSACTGETQYFYSIAEASRRLGIAFGGICECVNGKRVEFGGYKFSALEVT